MIYKNAFLSLGGTNLSAHLESVEPSFEVEMGDDTVMGDTGRSNEPGLENVTITARFKNPFTATTGPDAVIWPLKGTTFTVIFRPHGASSSTSNPSYTITMTWNSWNPTGGSVGDVMIGTLSLVGAPGVATRATS